MKDMTQVPLTFSQGLLNQVVLGLQLCDEVSALKKLLQLLQNTSHTHTTQSGVLVFCLLHYRLLLSVIAHAHRKVELLRLLLIGSSFGEARLTEVRFAESGLYRLHAVAVVEAV